MQSTDETPLNSPTLYILDGYSDITPPVRWPMAASQRELSDDIPIVPKYSIYPWQTRQLQMGKTQLHCK